MYISQYKFNNVQVYAGNVEGFMDVQLHWKTKWNAENLKWYKNISTQYTVTSVLKRNSHTQLSHISVNDLSPLELTSVSKCFYPLFPSKNFLTANFVSHFSIS